MDKRSAGVYIVMQKMGGFKIDELDDRVYFQKVIYLLQLLGVNLGFRFSWYKLGPYSNDLAKTAYGIKESINDYRNELDNVTVREDVIAKINELKTLESAKPDDIERHKWFELVSSIHYLKYISTTDPNNITIQNITEQLKRAGKSDFADTHVRTAWNQLDRLGLIENKSLSRMI